MAVNSRAKGKRAELDVAHILQAYGYDARRGQQYSGASGDPDVIGLPGIHLEVKRVERLNLDAAYAQAVNDKRDGEIPVVVHRKSRQPWMVTMSFDDWLILYGGMRGD